MSVYSVQSLACGGCGLSRVVKVVDSANPLRHPPFLVDLLDRTFNRFPCEACGHVDVNEGPMLWTDVTADLVAWMQPSPQRLGWPEAEVTVLQGLEGPVRHEGPGFVRNWGAGARIRLVFGLEELREKVVARRHQLDDAVVEAIKLPYLDYERALGPVLEAVDDDGLRLAWPAPVNQMGRADVGALDVDARTVAVLPWADYAAAIDQRDLLAAVHPGLFTGTWVHWARAPFAPAAHGAAN